MKNIKKLMISYWPLLFLATLLVLLFWQVIFRGYVYMDGDNFHLNIPMKYLFVDAIKYKFFPFWNPYILSGIPYAADLNLGTFNILNLLYLLLPVPRALTVQSIIDLFLIGAFQFVLLRTIKLTKLSALIGSVVWMLSGTVFIFTSNVAIMHPITYIPLIFIFVHLLFSTRKKIYLFFLVLSQVLQIISGHPQITYYTLFFLIVYIFFQNISFSKKLFYTFFYLLFSLLVSAFQLLPFFEYVSQSNRPVGSLLYASGGAMDVAHLIPIIFPTFFGSKLHGNWWGPQAMLSGYIGTVSLILLIIGIKYARFKEKNYYMFSIILSFLLSLGLAGLVYLPFYYIIPGWSSLRSPAIIFVMTTFFSTIFVAHGASYITNHQSLAKLLGKKLRIFALLLIPFIFILILTTYFISWMTIILMLQNLHVPFVSRVLFYSPTKIQNMFSGITWNVVIFLSFLATCALLFRVLTKKIIISLLLLISIDLLFIDRTYLQLVPLSSYTQTVSHISSDVRNGLYRVFPKPVMITSNRRVLPGKDFFYNEAKLNLAELTDNHVIPLDVSTITGYTSLVPKRYQQYIGGKNITGIDNGIITTDKLNQLAVNEIISVNQKGRVFVTNNPGALPRIRLLESNSQNYVIFYMSENPNALIMDISSTKKNTLIVADSYYPGWRAMVNDQEETINPYEKTFRSVQIPSGFSHVVVFYDMLIWKIGIVISLISLATLYVYVRTKKIYV